MFLLDYSGANKNFGIVFHEVHGCIAFGSTIGIAVLDPASSGLGLVCAAAANRFIPHDGEGSG
jgi:hypothetical protein